jgi:hypothetical protein
MKIRPMGAHLFYADLDRRTNGQTYRQAGRDDEANSRLSKFANAPKIHRFKFT